MICTTWMKVKKLPVTEIFSFEMVYEIIYDIIVVVFV